MKALDCLKIMSNPKLTKCHHFHVLKTSQNIFPRMISCDFHLIPTKGIGFAALPGPSRGGPWPSEAATTSSRRPASVTSRGPAPPADGARRRGLEGLLRPHRAARGGGVRPRGDLPGAAGSGGRGRRQD